MAKKIIGVSLILILLVSLCSCTKLVTEDGEDYTNYKNKAFSSLEFFGTETYLVIGANFKDKDVNKKAESLWDTVKSELRVLDNLFNENIKTSDIAKFNSLAPGEKLEIHEHTYDLLNMSLDYYKETNGKFNPAVARLVDLWGFTPRFTKDSIEIIEDYDRADYKENLPSEEYINAFVSLSKFDEIKLENKDNKFYVIKPDTEATVNKKSYSMNIALGGIGKGYACDIVNEIVKQEFHFGYVSIGNSSMSIAQSIKPIKEQKNPLNWKVSITDPRKEGVYMSLYLCDTSISTSGDYERYYENNGQRYCHIINSDGYPIKTHMLTATVTGESAAMCDALTTAICCMNKDEAISFMDSKFVKDNALKIYFINQNEVDKTIYSNAEYTLLNEEYIKSI